MRNMLQQLQENSNANRAANAAKTRAIRVRIMAAMVDSVGMENLVAENISLTSKLPVKLSER